MQAFIIAGGKGTRLSQLTNDEIPKPMAVMDGKPVLLRAIESLTRYGITDFFISVGHLAEKITGYFGDGAKFGVKISYITENEPLGSGGALYYLKGKVKGDFIVCSGDLIFNVDINKMLAFHKEKDALITLFTHPNLHPYDSDLVIADKDGKVINFDFKGKERNYYYKNNVNAGFFIMNEKSLDYINTPAKISLEKDFINSLITAGEKVYSYKSPEYVKDAGTVERFFLIENDVKSKLVEKKSFINKQKAIFLDRDGVINKYKGFINSANDIELINKVSEGIKLINRSEYLAVIISNQPVIARGECSFSEVDKMFDKIETLLALDGAYIDGIYYCPHHPHKGYAGEVKELKIDCNCRKPKIGLIEKAVKDFNLDLSKCFIIGDSEVDVLTGINANIPQIKVKSDLQEEEKTAPTYRAENLVDAVKLILGEKI